MTLFALTCKPLELSEAHALMDALESAMVPLASAVSMDEVDEAHSLWQVVAYYEVEPQHAGIAPLLTSLGIRQGSIAIERLPDTNWVAASLEGLAPVTAGRFFVHGSHQRARFGGIALAIDASTAFGTGHHGTTRGCLMALDAILKHRRPCRILDIGCGTGVLAIAAARAARCNALASDIDPEAVRVTRANANRNWARTYVHTITANGTNDSRIAANAPFDLIFANILARPLIALAAAITQLTARHGDIVLSGLTVDQERWVLAAYRNRNAVLHRRIHLDGWSTLWLKND